MDGPNVNKQLEARLLALPSAPGVYFHKDALGEIIYVGKAAVLKKRVRQYFKKSRTRDPKTQALVAEIADTDWMVVESEVDALFLEAEMIQRYRPRFNAQLRDDKSMLYIRVDYDSDFPTVSTTRQPLDDGARYFGPYPHAGGVRRALKSLRRVFPFATRPVRGHGRATLHYQLGLDPGLEAGKTSLAQYRSDLRKLMAVIEGKRATVEKALKHEMTAAAGSEEFEKAARIRNRLLALHDITRHVVFGDGEFLDIGKDRALGELVGLLRLSGFPQRIEGYDISHLQGTNVVAGMVVFSNGVSNRREYRKFKMSKQRNDDVDNVHETITRRLSEKNIRAWGGLPDLILVDGGKAQLAAAIHARDARAAASDSGERMRRIPCIGLAERAEQIVIKTASTTSVAEPGSSQEERAAHGDRALAPAVGQSNVELDREVLRRLGGNASGSDDFVLINLPHDTHLVKLLQRIRDEAHRFAVSYHATLRSKAQTTSILDDVPGIGPVTRRKLLVTFGSLRGVKQASESNLAAVIGYKKARVLHGYLRPIANTSKR